MKNLVYLLIYLVLFSCNKSEEDFVGSYTFSDPQIHNRKLISPSSGGFENFRLYSFDPYFIEVSKLGETIKVDLTLFKLIKNDVEREKITGRANSVFIKNDTLFFTVANSKLFLVEKGEMILGGIADNSKGMYDTFIEHAPNLISLNTSGLLHFETDTVEIKKNNLELLKKQFGEGDSDYEEGYKMIYK